MLLEIVRDSGFGISSEIMDKIFDPFFTTKDSGKGTGLGLSTVLGIVKSHNGTIKCESTPGNGTLFQVTLPAILSQEKSQVGAKVTPPSAGKGQLILVVDDEAEIRKAIRLALIRQGYEVLTAENGSTAIVEFSENKGAIKLVITDMMMPGLDGSLLAKTIRSIKPDVTILATSGVAEHQGIPEAGRFLKKPFTTEELLRAVEELLQAAR